MVKRKIKRYKPKRRLRLVKTFSTKNLTLTSYVVLVVSIATVVFYYSSKIKIPKIAITSNVITSISIVYDDVQIKNNIEKITHSYLSGIYTREVSSELEKKIRGIYPYIKTKISFNPILGRMTIRLEKLRTIAKLIPQNLYLLEDFSISNLTDDETKRYPVINIYSDIIFENKDVKNCIANILDSKILDMFEDSILSFEDRNAIIMFGRSKLVLPLNLTLDENRINQVKQTIEDAKKRLGNEIIVDLRYLMDDRIIISPLIEKTGKTHQY